MNKKIQILFWTMIIIRLTIIAGMSLGNLVLAIFFVSFLFPVVLTTAMIFNNYLVPRFLLKNRIGKFILYFIYLLIVSIYLELLIIILAFAILANYQIENLGGITGDIYLLTVTMYLIVFIHGFVLILKTLRSSEMRLNQLEANKERNLKTTITIKVNRKNIPILISDIVLIESFRDFVKVHMQTEQFTTKMKISAFQAALPDSFLRIHRSFLINRNYIQTFRKDQVELMNQSYPIGRTYKKACLEILETGNRVEKDPT